MASRREGANRTPAIRRGRVRLDGIQGATAAGAAKRVDAAIWAGDGGETKPISVLGSDGSLRTRTSSPSSAKHSTKQGCPARTSGGSPAVAIRDVIRPSIFDYRGAVPVLLDVLPQLTRAGVKETVVRSLSTAHARPAAATALLEEFRFNV
jgi:hypothetical protein